MAAAELRGGARVDAIVTAVELGLAPRLKEIAAVRGVATTNGTGQPLKLSRINNALAGAGAYPESDRAQVEAWLKLRNDVAHPDGAQAVSAARVAGVIAGIRVFLDEHPV